MKVKKLEKRKRKRRVVIAIGIILVLLVVLIFFKPTLLGNFISNFKKPAVAWEPVVVNEGNFAPFLSSLSLVQELPKNANVLLKTYNFENGERVWESEYVIREGVVIEGSTENPDVIIDLHSKYISKFGNGPCQAIQLAKSNGDLVYEFKIGKAGLLWRYKKMIGYKNCFGI